MLFADARALFERSVHMFPDPKGKILWDRWGRYEYQYGGLEAVLKFAKRSAEAFKEGALVPAHTARPLTCYLQCRPSNVSQTGTSTGPNLTRSRRETSASVGGIRVYCAVTK